MANTVLVQIKACYISFLLSFIICPVAFAQLLSEGKAEGVGMSTERLDRIEPVIKDYVSKGKIAGAVALVVRNGRIVYYKGIGEDDNVAKIPLKRDAIFRIASQTKAITSAAVMMLFEEGKFLLDDPISTYISTFKGPRILVAFNSADSSYTTRPAKREITIRDLLTHTSGVSYAVIGAKEAAAIYAKNKIPSGIETSDNTLGEAITKLGTLPLLHEPGEKFTYGLNTDILGYLVEVVSGKTLNEFMNSRIFEPLGMKDTYFYLPKEKQNRLVKFYGRGKDGSLVQTDEALGNSVNYPKEDGKYYSGGGGLSSTAYDYAIFLQTLLNGGIYNGKRILSPGVVNLMTQNQIGELYEGNNKFGLGFSIASEQEAARIPISKGSFSWGGIFGTTYWADPKEKVIALLMTQSFPKSSWGEMQDKFKVLVYQAITAQR
jgi:CubicO group peptidase (beta-lactamase class C family)